MNTEIQTEWPWLYQKAKRGVNRWQIRLSISEDSTVDIVTSSGMYDQGKSDDTDPGESVSKKRKIDYKLTESRRKIAKGKNIGKKNETTILQQASLEAQSKYQKYIEKGYTPTIEEMKEAKSVFLPMLAHPYEKRGKDIAYPAIGQYKLDGIRVMAYIDGASVKLLSRTGKELHNFEGIRQDVMSVINKSGRSHLVLDGELYTDAFPFEELSGLCRLKPCEEPDDSMEHVQLWVFDCYDSMNVSAPFSERFRLIDENGKVRKVPTWGIADVTQVDSSLDKCVNDGYEGLILRNDMPYQLNTRSVNLQKMKRFYDDEFEIVGYSEAKGNDRGTIIFECKNKDGEMFSVRPEGSRELRKQYIQDFDKLKGKQLTVKYQELTKSGVPRFPVGIAVRDYE